ncbi:hypothetical protein [Nonomuraea sp. NPDC003201]
MNKPDLAHLGQALRALRADGLALAVASRLGDRAVAASAMLDEVCRSLIRKTGLTALTACLSIVAALADVGRTEFLVVRDSVETSCGPQVALWNRSALSRAGWGTAWVPPRSPSVSIGG